MPKKRTGRGKRRVDSLKSLQRKLWRLNLALALAVFLMLAVWWIGVALGTFPAFSDREEWLMEQADLTAIIVFAADIYSGFRKAKDKKLFLRKNWLEIIVLLPLGTVFRMFRAFGQLGKLDSVLAARKGAEGVMEIPIVIPDVITRAKEVGKGALEAHQWVSHGKTFTEFSDNISNLLKGLPKI